MDMAWTTSIIYNQKLLLRFDRIGKTVQKTRIHNTISLSSCEKIKLNIKYKKKNFIFKTLIQPKTENENFYHSINWHNNT